MVLLTLMEYQQFLNIEFSHLEPAVLGGLSLQSHYLPDSEIQWAEHLLDMGELPTSFIQLIQHYDFGGLTIGNIQFGTGETGSLTWLLKLNDSTHFGFESFIKELRQSSLLIIANGDPFAILLDIKTGFITALSSEESIATRLPVASSFQHFIEGIGTAYKARLRDEAAAFLALAREEFGLVALPFWKEVVS